MWIERMRMQVRKPVSEHHISYAFYPTAGWWNVIAQVLKYSFKLVDSFKFMKMLHMYVDVYVYVCLQGVVGGFRR